MVCVLLEFVARHGVVLAAETERRLEAARGHSPNGAKFASAMAPAQSYFVAPICVDGLASLQNTGLMQVFSLNGREW